MLVLSKAAADAASDPGTRRFEGAEEANVARDEEKVKGRGETRRDEIADEDEEGMSDESNEALAIVLMFHVAIGNLCPISSGNFFCLLPISVLIMGYTAKSRALRPKAAHEVARE